MKTSDIIAVTRQQFLSDTKHPYLWSDVFLVNALMEADKEAARRAFLLRETALATAADVATGSATSTVSGELVDSAAAFTSAMVGLTAYNTLNNTWSLITGFNDAHTLVLADDIMVSGNPYIIGTQSQALTRVCVQSGIGIYFLSDKALKIDTCRLASQYQPLIKKSEGWLDNHFSNWRNAVGAPRYFLEQRGTVQIVPKPDSTLNQSTGVDTMILEVFRLPINVLSMTSVTYPEVPAEYHLSLIDWMCHLAFKNPDSDMYNQGKSELYQTSFESKFGRPVSALEEENVRAIGGMMKLSRPRW